LIRFLVDLQPVALAQLLADQRLVAFDSSDRLHANDSLKRIALGAYEQVAAELGGAAPK